MGEWERINDALKEKALRHMPEVGVKETAVPGLSISRRLAHDILENSLYKPCIGVMLQGRKKSIIGMEEYIYGEGQCLVVGVDVPSSFYVMDGTEDAPFLCLSLAVDSFLLTRLAAEVPPSPENPSASSMRGVSVENVDVAVLDAFSRLMDLLDRPEHISMLAPMIIKEIYYRMLLGPQGDFLRRFHTLGSQSTQIAQAVTWLRDNYRSPLQVEELRVGLQFGVILDGDMEPAEQRRELAAFADLLALRGRGRARTQVGDARQELVLVAHVGLDRGHQIRDQVVALLQDHADAAPALPDTVASGDQAVVRDDAPYDQQHGDCSHDDNKDCSGRHNVYLLSGSVFSGLSRNFRVSAASILLLRYSGFRPGP